MFIALQNEWFKKYTRISLSPSICESIFVEKTKNTCNFVLQTPPAGLLQLYDNFAYTSIIIKGLQGSFECQVFLVEELFPLELGKFLLNWSAGWGT